MLWRRASDPRRGFFRQQNNMSQNRRQQLLKNSFQWNILGQQQQSKHSINTHILDKSSLGDVAGGATDEPSTIAASVAVIPTSGSRSRHATLGSAVLWSAPLLRRHGIQKQHLRSSVSSPVRGSTLFTERQQNIFVRQSPHFPCCFGAGWWTDWCIGSSPIVLTFDCFSLSSWFFFGFLWQLLQQFDVGQQRDFLFFLVSSTTSSCVVVVVALLLALESTGCSSTEPWRRSGRRPQQRMQWERRNRMHSVLQQRQTPPLPASSLRNSWLPVLRNKR